MTSPFDARPLLIAIAGPNGAGKTTFFRTHLEALGLRYLNPDEVAQELGTSAYEAAEISDHMRRALVAERESFVFETVFSDPAGEKLRFLRNALDEGFTVIVCFIALEDANLSEERVALRVLQGGHDVPADKLTARFPRTLWNLAQAIRVLPHVLIFDNSDLEQPFRHVATFDHQEPQGPRTELPEWLQALLKS